MAGSGIEDVTPKVEIEGLDQATSEMGQFGDTGAQSLNKITAAAGEAGERLGFIEAMAKRVGVSYEEMQNRISHASENLAKNYPVKDPGGDGSAHKQATQDIDEHKEHLKELGIIGAEAFSKILNAASDGNITGVIAASMGKVASAIFEVGKAAFEFTRGQAEMVETLENLATATGMTFAQIQGLQSAFASVGISTNGFERAMGRLAITIANQWSQIQQNVRTSADTQTGAMLAVQQAALSTTRAYNSLHTAFQQSSNSAINNALGIESAALALRRASNALMDASVTSQRNSLSVESAQLALIRARMNLARSNGQAINPADERAMQIAQDTLAVKEAEMRLTETRTRKAREGLEMEELTLRVAKARQDLAEAEQRRVNDAVAGADRIRQAQLDIQKARLAQSEVAERQHQADLNNIPEIARQIQGVVSGYQNWSQVMNHAEISAQNLTKAVILAASGGGGSGPPRALDVFMQMSSMFKNMGDSADAMNRKLAIVQHTMASGFRAGQASAAQLLAILQRGPEELRKFLAEADKFSKVRIGGFNTVDKHEDSGITNAVVALERFNSAYSQFETAVGQVKNRLAAITAVPMADFFTQLKDSIYDTNGVMFRFAAVLADIYSRITTIVTGFANVVRGVAMAINSLVTGISSLTGLKPETVFEVMGIAAIALLPALRGIALAIVTIVARLAILGAGVGAVIQALGALVAVYQLLTGGAKDWATASDNAITRAGKLITQGSLGAMGIDARNTSVGLNDQQMKEMGMAAQQELAAAQASQQAAAQHTQSAGAHGQAAQRHSDAAGSLNQAGNQIVANLGTAGADLKGAAVSLTDAAAALRAAAMSPRTGAAAEGGLISGPGGPRDDKAGLFALSDGEYVVKSAAVSHYGTSMFEALNNMRFGGFASGGLVGARAPSVPAGSAGGASSILNLTIDGNHFDGLRAPESVAGKLKNYAVTRQTASAGKMPTWMR